MKKGNPVLSGNGYLVKAKSCLFCNKKALMILDFFNENDYNILPSNQGTLSKSPIKYFLSSIPII